MYEVTKTIIKAYKYSQGFKGKYEEMIEIKKNQSKFLVFKNNICNGNITE